MNPSRTFIPLAGLVLMAASSVGSAWNAFAGEPVSSPTLQSLERQRASMLTQAQKLVPDFRKRIELIERFQKLLRVRYTDENGDFDVGAEIPVAERERVETLCRTTLDTGPAALGLPTSKTSVSAGRAMAALDLARQELKFRADALEHPTPENHSGLQVIQARTGRERARLEEELDQERQENARAPASVERKAKK